MDREAALREAGQRADEVGRQAADHPRAQEHRVDVPVGVVVGEDRLAEVVLGAGGAQVARGGEDRVDRVVRVLDAVACWRRRRTSPGRGQELHPAERAGGGDVEVAAVVGLDLVDRRQDLPADAVLDAGGLVDREQERRDPELVDEEVRDADRRGARLGQREGRVVERRRAVGVAAGGRRPACAPCPWRPRRSRRASPRRGCEVLPAWNACRCALAGALPAPTGAAWSGPPPACPPAWPPWLAVASGVGGFGDARDGVGLTGSGAARGGRDGPRSMISCTIAGEAGDLTEVDRRAGRHVDGRRDASRR